MIFDLLEKEKEYKERAIKNDTITSLKTNFGNECICSQLFEGLKQSMLYSGLIEDINGCDIHTHNITGWNKRFIYFSLIFTLYIFFLHLLSPLLPT